MRLSLAESFRTLQTNLSFQALERPLRAIVVTSPLPGKGKSTVAINLAAALARSGQRTLLVDADLHHPTLHRRLGLENSMGLSLCLLDPERPQPIISSTDRAASLDPHSWPDTAKFRGIARLWTHASLPRHAACWAGRRVRRWDGGGCGGDRHASHGRICRCCCAGRSDRWTILVVDGGKSPAGPVLWTKDALTRAHARLLGVVLIQAQWLWGAAANGEISQEPGDERDVIEPEQGGATPDQAVTQTVKR